MINISPSYTAISSLLLLSHAFFSVKISDRNLMFKEFSQVHTSLLSSMAKKERQDSWINYEMLEDHVVSYFQFGLKVC